VGIQRISLFSDFSASSAKNGPPSAPRRHLRPLHSRSILPRVAHELDWPDPLPPDYLWTFGPRRQQCVKYVPSL
jgi:hypothetical protein